MPSFLSQSHLSILSTCPRKYRYIYVDGLSAPISLLQQRSMEWGAQFHQLMQQRSLGLPVDRLMEAYPEIKACFKALEQADPVIFGSLGSVGSESGDAIRPDFFRQSEHARSYPWPVSMPSSSNSDRNDRWIFRVVYDLLLLQPGQAQILDWKTYPQPRNLAFLRDHWQTRLYLFVLVETTEYQPEDVSMIYWFVRHQSENGTLTPQSCQFSYDRFQHEATRQELEEQIKNLSQWQKDYSQANYSQTNYLQTNHSQTGDPSPPFLSSDSSPEPFPKIPESSTACIRCNFNQRCDRSDLALKTQETLNWENLLAIDSIPATRL